MAAPTLVCSKTTRSGRSRSSTAVITSTTCGAQSSTKSVYPRPSTGAAPSNWSIRRSIWDVASEKTHDPSAPRTRPRGKPTRELVASREHDLCATPLERDGERHQGVDVSERRQRREDDLHGPVIAWPRSTSFSSSDHRTDPGGLTRIRPERPRSRSPSYRRERASNAAELSPMPHPAPHSRRWKRIFPVGRRVAW